MMLKLLWITLLLNLDLKIKYQKIRLPISRGKIVHFWSANILTPLHASFGVRLQDDDLFCELADVLLLKNTPSIDAEICRIECGKN